MGKSEWLKSGKKPCGKCGGSGEAGENAKGETIVCPACLGWGYK